MGRRLKKTDEWVYIPKDILVRVPEMSIVGIRLKEDPCYLHLVVTAQWHSAYKGRTLVASDFINPEIFKALHAIAHQPINVAIMMRDMLFP